MKAVFLIPQIGFNDNELLSMKKILEKGKIDCALASFSGGKVIGKFGAGLKAAFSFTEIKEKDFDIAIVVGGENVSSLIEYRDVTDFVCRMLENAKIVALLCMNPALFLQKIDFLKDKKMTVFKSKNRWSVDYVRKNAIYIDKEIVIDSNLLTCANEEDAEKAAKEILKIIKEKKNL